MKSKKFKEGMQVGAAPFEEYAKKQEENFRKFRDEEYSKAWEVQREINENLIDAISLSEGERERLCEELRRKNNEKLSFKKQKVIITFEKDEDKEMAEKLRSSLEEKGDISSVLNDDEYKRNLNDADFVVVIRSDWGNIKPNYQIIYKDDYGILIVKNNNMIFACYKEIKIESSSEKFVSYYKEVVGTQIEDDKKIKELLEKRDKRWKGYKGKAGDFVSEIEIKTKVAPFYIYNPLLRGLAQVALFPARVLSSLLAIPVIIAECEVEDVIMNLQGKSFNKKFVKKAQRHILQVKVFEYICSEQVRSIIES